MAFGLLGGVNSVVAGNSYLEIKTNSVKSNAWEWAIWYQLSTPLESGEIYVLTMDAKCSENYSMSFWPVNTAEGGKTLYTGYSIGTEWSVCTCEFTANDNLNRLVWDFGSLNGTLCFDNVKLVKKGETTNLVHGGDFESGLHANWGDDGWNSPVYSVYTTGSTPKKYLKMTTNAVKGNAWEWAIWYHLDTPLEKDKTYVLTMKAKCSEVYNMPFWPYKEEGGATNYEGYNIGTEWGDCSCTFTAVDNLDYLRWCFGSLNGTVCFDDVSLVEQGQSTNLINGGDFESGMASNWGDDDWNKPDYGVVIEYPVAEAEVPSVEVQLVQSMFKSWDSPSSGANITSNSPYWTAVDYGTEGGSGTVYYGSGNVSYLDYADLSEYSALKVYGTGSDLRILMNRVSDGGALTEVHVTPSVDGTLLDLTSYPYVHLNAIKVVNGGGATTITNITLIDPNANPSVDYVLSGDIKDGLSSASVTSALADANAKVIDVTGVTGSGIGLVSANPNCLFVANAGTLSNDYNVIVGTTCANLVLTDSKPFKAPFDFTAAAATYNTTINTTAQAGTLYLPYAAAIPDGVDAWTLTYSGGDNVTATKINTGTIPANTPVLLNGSGSKDFTGSSVAIDADATNVSGALTGVFEQGYVPKDSYVLQNKSGVLAFYKVAAENSVTIKPFRAYLTASAGARLYIDFDDEETTGITNNKCETTSNNRYFDLQGREVAQPTTGLYIVNGKKVLVK